MPLPKNPYIPNNNHNVVGGISDADFFFVKQLIPGLPRGAWDSIISNLLHRFITELRNVNNTEQLEPAYFIDHPTVTRIEELIQRCSFGVTDRGTSGSRDDAAATGGLRKTVRNTKAKRTNTASRVSKGRRSPLGGQAETNEETQG